MFLFKHNILWWVCLLSFTIIQVIEAIVKSKNDEKSKYFC